MILTNEIELLRENLSLLPGNLSLHDPLVSKEWVGHLRQSPIFYQSSNGYCFANMDSILLMDRALGPQQMLLLMLSDANMNSVSIK